MAGYPINATVLIDATEILASSKIEVGQIGPQGLPGSGTNTLAVYLTNRDTVTLQAGMAVAMAPTGDGVVRATKVTSSDKRGFGIVPVGGIVGAQLMVVVGGECEVADWTVATGGAWLPPNSRLFLGIDGQMVTSPGAILGEFNQEMAKVIAPQKVIVNPSSLRIINQ